MLINYDPDEYEGVAEHCTCAFHLANPGQTFAGCTCSASYSQRRRTPEEIAKIKADRQLAEDEEILRKAEIIKARRAADKGGKP